MSYGGNKIPDSWLKKHNERTRKAIAEADQERFERKINKQFGLEDA